MRDQDAKARGGPGWRRGTLLLEVLLALAVFVGAGLAILTVLERSTDALARVRDHRQACDLALSAIARIEAGLDTPESLDGPVPEWEDMSDGRAIEAAGGGKWEIDIKTEPSQFSGLTKITVEAIKRRAGDPDGEALARYSIAQVVRTPLGLSPKDGAPEDEIGRRQREGAGAPVSAGDGERTVRGGA